MEQILKNDISGCISEIAINMSNCQQQEIFKKLSKKYLKTILSKDSYFSNGAWESLTQMDAFPTSISKQTGTCVAVESEITHTN